MKRLYHVTFTHHGQKYGVDVEANNAADAIQQAQEIGFGENWEVVHNDGQETS